MTFFEVLTRISAPPEQCFDLARAVDFRVRVCEQTGERVTMRPDHDLLTLGDEMEVERRYLGVRRQLRSEIDQFKPPVHFREVATQSAFRQFTHDRSFVAIHGGTMMIDQIRFEAPLGPISSVAERKMLEPYLTRLIRKRAQALKEEAERLHASEHAALLEQAS